jgi:hypothetical protein
MAVAMVAAPGTAAARFSGNVCHLPSGAQLTAAHISGACTKVRTRTETSHTRLGTLTQTKFAAHWGFLPTTGAGHVLTIGVTRVTGDHALLVAARARFRSRTLSEGVPVGIGSVSEWHGETAACLNPPSEDCTTVHVSALVGNYILAVVLIDVPTNAPAPEDEPVDLEQEEADKAPVVAIAKAVAKAL